MPEIIQTTKETKTTKFVYSYHTKQSLTFIQNKQKSHARHFLTTNRTSSLKLYTKNPNRSLDRLNNKCTIHQPFTCCQSILASSDSFLGHIVHYTPSKRLQILLKSYWTTSVKSNGRFGFNIEHFTKNSNTPISRNCHPLPTSFPKAPSQRTNQKTTLKHPNTLIIKTSQALPIEHIPEYFKIIKTRWRN